MSKLRTITILIISILLLSGCGGNSKYLLKPHGYTFLTQAPQEGTPGFRLGWYHGCESGFGSQFGGEFFMAFYTWQRDQDLIIKNPDIAKIKAKYEKELPIDWNNPEEIKKNLSDYKKVFWHAHSFCRHTALGTHQASASPGNNVYEPPLPGEQHFKPGGHNLSNIYSFKAGHHSGFLSWW